MSQLKFIQAQQPLVDCLKLFGFFAYKIEPEWSISWKLKAYSTSIILLSNVFFLVNGLIYVRTSNEFLGDGSNVTMMCHLVEVTGTQFAAWSIVFAILWTKKQQIEFLTTLQTVEDELAALPFSALVMEKSFRFIRISSWIVILSSICFYVSLNFLYVLVLMKDESITHAFHITNLLVFSVYVLFISTFFFHLMATVQIFFEAMNRNLRVFVTKSDFYQKEIRLVMQLHHKLTYASSAFSESFGVIVFALFIFLFSCLTLESYFVYVTILLNLTNEKYILYAIADTTWLLPHLAMMQLIGRTCSKIQQKIQETASIIKSCDLDNSCEKLLSKWLLNSAQADNNFTANGLFVINDSFIYNVNFL